MRRFRISGDNKKPIKTNMRTNNTQTAIWVSHGIAMTELIKSMGEPPFRTVSFRPKACASRKETFLNPTARPSRATTARTARKMTQNRCAKKERMMVLEFYHCDYNSKHPPYD